MTSETSSETRFVILYHEMPPESGRGSHFDLMFERNGTLATWSVSAILPGMNRATRLADHRLDYLTYEGPVSENRGRVERRDSGEYSVIGWTEEAAAFEIDGRRWRGHIALRHVEDAQWEVLLALIENETYL